MLSQQLTPKLFIMMIVMIISSHFLLMTFADVDTRQLIRVTGQGSAKVKLTETKLNVVINIDSQQFGTKDYTDIEMPYGVDRLPTSQNDINNVFFPIIDQRGSGRFSSSAVFTELQRRTKSVLNYLTAFNATSTNTAATGTATTKPTTVINGDGVVLDTIDDLTDGVAKPKIIDVKTERINVDKQYKWDNGKQELVGYTGIATISIRLPVQYADEILPLLTRVGGSEINNFTLLPTKTDLVNAQDDAETKATLDAMKRIDNVLTTLKLRREYVASIDLDNNNVSSSNNGFGGMVQQQFKSMDAMMMNAAPASGEGSGMVSGDTMDITRTVTVLVAYSE